MADGPQEWEEAHRPLIGRMAGALVLIGLASGFVDPAATGSQVFANLTTKQIVDWAAHNGPGISFMGFAKGCKTGCLRSPLCC